MVASTFLAPLPPIFCSRLLFSPCSRFLGCLMGLQAIRPWYRHVAFAFSGPHPDRLPLNSIIRATGVLEVVYL
jgi:hypothetical protein